MEATTPCAACRICGSIRLSIPSRRHLVAIHTRMNFQEMERTIWLDGRPHPSDMAPHTFQGFSTATWDGNMLNVYTTHLKESYLRRNGLPRSSKATFREHWVRHGNYLTVITAITDPAFLTEPLVRSQTWILDPNQRIGRDICEYGPEVPAPRGAVPAHLPGTNPFLHEVANWYGLPYRGDARWRRNALPRVPVENAETRHASGKMRTILRLRQCRPGLQSDAGTAATLYMGETRWHIQIRLPV